jgi:signal transduction histidine kinase
MERESVSETGVVSGRRSDRPSLNVKTVLIVGFCLTAGTWLFAGAFFGNRMRGVQSEAVEVSRRYMQAQALLSDARAELYRAGIVIRDALLDTNANAGRYRGDLDAAYREADQLLAQYVPVTGSQGEHDRTRRLRQEIAELRAETLEVLSRETVPAPSSLIATYVIPRRETAMLVATELQTLNRNAYVQHQTATAALYRQIQNGFWRAFGMAVLATLCIAVFSAKHVKRLERKLRLEQEKDARTAVELQSLSAKLVSAQEEERRTIARELHDEIGQVITVVKMELAHAQRYITSLGGVPEFLDDARAITDRALGAVRDISHFLHPSVLDDLGLPAAIQGYIQRINRGQELRIEFSAENSAARLTSDMEVALYRIVQEGITNVLRHARAETCEVLLTRDSSRGTVVISISDDGVGFDVAAPRSLDSRGLGLVGMRERVAQLGGELCVTSTVGAGTTLVARFPLVRSAE